MSATIRIPQERLAGYFDAFTKRFLRDESPEAVDVEVLAPDLDDQLAAGAPLIGITYDPHDNALEFALESGDHRAFQPQEVWVMEEPDGFLSTIEVVRADGLREVVRAAGGSAAGTLRSCSRMAPPPRVLVVSGEQWPRVLLRAQLGEARYDAIGARTLSEALSHPPDDAERARCD